MSSDQYKSTLPEVSNILLNSSWVKMAATNSIVDCESINLPREPLLKVLYFQKKVSGFRQWIKQDLEEKRGDITESIGFDSAYQSVGYNVKIILSSSLYIYIYIYIYIS
jgi:hypothetical protein